MHWIKSVRGCLLTHDGANNAFDKVQKSIFQARPNENFRSLKRLIIFLPETTDRRPAGPSSSPLPFCQLENGIWDGIGVDKIDKLSAWKMQNRCAHTYDFTDVRSHVRTAVVLVWHIARVSPYTMNSGGCMFST